MRTWEEYERYVKAINPVVWRDMDEAEQIAKAISAFQCVQKNVSLSKRILDILQIRQITKKIIQGHKINKLSV